MISDTTTTTTDLHWYIQLSLFVLEVIPRRRLSTNHHKERNEKFSNNNTDADQKLPALVLTPSSATNITQRRQDLLLLASSSSTSNQSSLCCSSSSASSMKRRHRQIISTIEMDVTAMKRSIVEQINIWLNNVIDFFVKWNISIKVVDNVSLFCLAIHIVFHFNWSTIIKHMLLQQQPESTTTTTEGSVMILPLQQFVSINWTLCFHVILGIAPAICFIFSFTFFIAILLRWRVDEACILAGLIALVLVECLVPLTFLISIILHGLQIVTASSAIALTMLVWLASWISGRVVRNVLYPSLGQG